MRILVYPHVMEIGGSQLNAIQLAAAVRDRGHDVTVFSAPGPLVDRVRELGLEHFRIPSDRRRPSRATVRQLATVVKDQKIDVVHGYEWPPVVEACFGPRLRTGTVVVGTVMSMSVVPFFPRNVPLVVGTELIREAALAAGHRRVILLEPPVDTDLDSPQVDGRGFRARHGIGPDEVLVVMVCRLVRELKLEGLLTACDATGELARVGHPIRLVIVGDGRARNEVAARARRADAAAGRPVVTLTGELADPRGAYAAADVIVGQGGSILRAAAYGKPLVVAGEQGFIELLTPGSAPLFLRQGWYGVGPGSFGASARALQAVLERLIVSPATRVECGTFARKLAVERFSLLRAARIQESEYERALVGDDGPQVRDLARCGFGVIESKLRRKYMRLRGSVVVDDANARPITEPVAAR